jgi:hypothetical protein
MLGYKFFPGMNVLGIEKGYPFVHHGKLVGRPGYNHLEYFMHDIVEEYVVMLFRHDQSGDENANLAHRRCVLGFVIFIIVRLLRLVFVFEYTIPRSS